jgi:peroxiredoxin
MVHLQKLHEQFASKGLVVLGFNSADKAEIAREHLKTNGVTYPTVLDNSTRAQMCLMETFHSSAVPTTYVIDRDGKVAAAWVGGRDDNAASGELLKKLGFDAPGKQPAPETPRKEPQK